MFVFAARQSSKQATQETGVHFNQVKRSHLSVMIGRFRSVLFVSVFQGLIAATIIRNDGSKKQSS